VYAIGLVMTGVRIVLAEHAVTIMANEVTAGPELLRALELRRTDRIGRVKLRLQMKRNQPTLTQGMTAVLIEDIDWSAKH